MTYRLATSHALQRDDDRRTAAIVS